MLIRLIHAQQTFGPLVVWDIEDGMPRKELAYLEKQPIYIDYSDSSNPSLPGHIDLVPTGKVLMSINNGQIAGFLSQDYIQIPIDIPSGTIEKPVITNVLVGASNLTIAGTDFISILPYVTSVSITGPGAITLTQSQITAVGGTVASTSIVIPNALIPGVTTASFVTANANNQNSNTAGGELPTVATAVISGTLTIAGTNLTSTSPQITSVIMASPAVTVTQSQITTAGGTVSATSIVMPTSLLPGVVPGASTLTVQADDETSTPAVTITATAPTLATATIGQLSNAGLVLVGTTFTTPLTVSIASPVLTITSTAITTAGGSIIATQINIPTSLTTGIVGGTSTALVKANTIATAAVTVGAGPVIGATSGATLSPLSITGSGFTSSAPQHSSVVITGPGAVTLSDTTISGAVGGSFAAASIVIPASLIPGVTTASSVVVIANGATSNSMLA